MFISFLVYDLLCNDIFSYVTLISIVVLVCSPRAGAAPLSCLVCVVKCLLVYDYGLHFNELYVSLSLCS